MEVGGAQLVWFCDALGNESFDVCAAFVFFRFLTEEENGLLSSFQAIATDRFRVELKDLEDCEIHGIPMDQMTAEKRAGAMCDLMCGAVRSIDAAGCEALLKVLDVRGRGILNCECKEAQSQLREWEGSQTEWALTFYNRYAQASDGGAFWPSRDEHHRLIQQEVDFSITDACFKLRGLANMTAAKQQLELKPAAAEALAFLTQHTVEADEGHTLPSAQFAELRRHLRLVLDLCHDGWDELDARNQEAYRQLLAVLGCESVRDLWREMSGMPRFVAAGSEIYRSSEALEQDPSAVASVRRALEAVSGGQAAETKASGAGQFEIDPDRLQVRIDNVCHDVTPAQLGIVQKLTQEIGVWKSGSDLQTVKGAEGRPDKTIQAMPDAVRKHIESHKSKGYRWTV